MPSGHGKRRASFLGWLSLKGKPSQEKGRKGATGQLGHFNQLFGQSEHGQARLDIALAGKAATRAPNGGPLGLRKPNFLTMGQGARFFRGLCADSSLQEPPRKGPRPCFTHSARHTRDPSSITGTASCVKLAIACARCLAGSPKHGASPSLTPTTYSPNQTGMRQIWACMSHVSIYQGPFFGHADF